MKKIAFMFLTIDNIYFPEIFEYYFANNVDKYTIYCHPKHPNKVTIPWLKSNIIPNLVETEWGHFTNAYVALLKQAVKNPDNFRFLYISESCLPTKSFDTLYQKMITDPIDRSYIKYVGTSGWGYKTVYTKQNILGLKITKHSGWFVLSRYHALRIVNFPKIDLFNKVHMGDEIILSIIANDKKNIEDIDMTYSNWSSYNKEIEELQKKIKSYYDLQDGTLVSYIEEIKELRYEKQKYINHPYVFKKITPKLVRFLRKQHSYFVRKFSKDSDIIEHYKEIF